MAKEFYSREYMEANTVTNPTRKSFTDLTGKVNDKLSVIGWAGISQHGKQKKPSNQWWCYCSCESNDYFLVADNSIKKNLTSSCGCNYKNNGSGTKDSLESAEGKLPEQYKLLSYNGRKACCKVECKVCGDVETFKEFYNVQQRSIWCGCKDMDALPKKIAESVGYTFIRRLSGRNMEASCNQCKTLRVAQASSPQWLDECPCKWDVGEDTTPACVYFNQDENNHSLYKIGKAIEPYSRLNQVNTSARKNGLPHKFRIKHMKWFVNEKVAFRVESMYHNWLKEKAVYGFKNTSGSESMFDGSGELFKVTAEDIIEFNRTYKSTIDFFEREQPEFVFTKQPYEHTSLQREKGISDVGVWFPNKKSLLAYTKLIKYSERRALLDVLDREDLTLKQMYISTVKGIRDSMFEVDGCLYESIPDFYEQHMHFTTIPLKVFRDRVGNHKWEVWDALCRPPQRKRGLPVLKDLDGTEIAINRFVDKYNLKIGNTTAKNLFRKGYTAQEIIDYDPERIRANEHTINYKGNTLPLRKVYSDLQLITELEYLLVPSRVFYVRVKRGWPITLAALVPSDKTYHLKSLLKADYVRTHIPEIIPHLKQLENFIGCS